MLRYNSREILETMAPWRTLFSKLSFPATALAGETSASNNAAPNSQHAAPNSKHAAPNYAASNHRSTQELASRAWCINPSSVLPAHGLPSSHCSLTASPPLIGLAESSSHILTLSSPSLLALSPSGSGVGWKVLTYSLISLLFACVSLELDPLVGESIGSLNELFSRGLLFLLGPFVGTVLTRWWSIRQDCIGKFAMPLVMPHTHKALAPHASHSVHRSPACHDSHFAPLPNHYCPPQPSVHSQSAALVCTHCTRACCYRQALDLSRQPRLLLRCMVPHAIRP